jgi:tetratricopeptide (TPR) repeat protein
MSEQGQTLTIEQAMERASLHYRDGRLLEAEAVLRQILKVLPAHPGALHLVGVMAYEAGQPDLGIALLARAIESDPQAGLFHSHLGEMHRQRGELEKAIVCGRRAVALEPMSAAALGNLGLACFDTGAHDEADDYLRRALDCQPGWAMALNGLGSVAMVRGETREAIDWYRRALAVAPDSIDPLNNLGLALLKSERSLEAIESLQRAVEVQPSHAEAWCNLGLAYQMGRRLDAAEAAFARSLQLRPNSPRVLLGLARSRMEQGRQDDALRLAERVVSIAPSLPDGWCLLADIHSEMGRGTEAIVIYRKLIDANPLFQEAILGLGHVLLEAGEFAEAKALFYRVLEIVPGHSAALFQLAHLEKVVHDDPLIPLLQAADARSRIPGCELPRQQAIWLDFALGKCCDDLKQFDKAFGHFAQGNRRKRETVIYSAEQTDAEFSEIAASLSKVRLDALRVGGLASSLPIFVVGMQRSGTTLTEQILASHPEVFGAGELPDLLAILNRHPSGSEHGYLANLRELNPSLLSAWATGYVDRLRGRAPGAVRVTDKMPSNFLAIGVIHLMLPRAKIVHVRRNPVDTCLSCYTRLFNRGQAFSYDLAELGRYYVAYARLMDHWRAVLPAGAFYEVCYEDLVADTEAESRRLLDYCELPWDPACLDFHKNSRVVRTASMTQVRQPIYRSSVERWREYEPFLGPLLEELRRGGVIE